LNPLKNQPKNSKIRKKVLKRGEMMFALTLFDYAMQNQDGKRSMKSIEEMKAYIETVQSFVSTQSRA
jgi:hypothetical protein